MDSISDFLRACGRGRYLELVFQTLLFYHISQTASAMGERQMLPWQMKSTFIIVLIYSFLPEMPCFARVPGVIVKCSEMTDCGKLAQIFSKLLLPLSSKIGSKIKTLTTKNF